jgi:hypothetical protein
MTVPGIFIAVKSIGWLSLEARLREQGGRGGVNLSPDGDSCQRRFLSR